jgi:glutamine synthetase
VFNGNGYSQEWVEEAQRRGLPNINCMVEAIPAIKSEKAVKLFEKHHVLTRAECNSRADILYEEYTKQINIEARTMIEMTLKQIRPAVIGYTKELADTVIALKEAGVDATATTKLLKEITNKLNAMDTALETLRTVLGEVSKIEVITKQAYEFRHKVFPAMEALRVPADELEMLVDEKKWPFPTYGDLLFYV